MLDTQHVLEQSFLAARRGDRRRARALLRQVLAREPRNEVAWLLLAHVAQSRQQALRCLERVLAINPDNSTARREQSTWQRARRRKTPSPRSTRRKTRLWKIGLSSLLALELTVGILLCVGYPWYAPRLPLFPSSVPGSHSFSSAAMLAPTPTLDPRFTATAAAATLPAHTPTPAALLPPTDSALPAAPPEANITGISGRPQSLPLDCEARSAVDWAAYFGVKIGELEFFNRLPQSDNPDTGFVGNVYGWWGQVPPNPYGVHAEPVAALLQTYGLAAQAVRSFSLDALRSEISAGRPVIAWVVGHVNPGTPVYYTAADGHSTTVARYEHTVIVVGYDDYGVQVLDGAQVYTRRWIDFERSWVILGNMVIIKRP